MLNLDVLLQVLSAWDHQVPLKTVPQMFKTKHTLKSLSEQNPSPTCSLKQSPRLERKLSILRLCDTSSPYYQAPEWRALLCCTPVFDLVPLLSVIFLP